MIAYHGDATLKAHLVDLVRWHRQQDHLAGGAYVQFREDGTPQFCSVGCSLYSLMQIRGTAPSLDDEDGVIDEDIKSLVSRHGDYEREAGVPEVIARLQDRIFEGLTGDDQRLLPEQFWAAIPVGADLSFVWPRLACWLMIDETFGVAQYLGDRRAVADHVAQLYAQRIAGIEPPIDAWRGARSDAWIGTAADAADSADSAAYAAAYAAAAYAADAAAYAAWAAAAAGDWADARAANADADAAWAAADAARFAFWRALRDVLLRLLATAPVPVTA